MSDALHDALAKAAGSLSEDKIEELEKIARLESLKLLVTNAIELHEDDPEKAKQYVENTVLTFTANAFKNGGLTDWLPFVIDAILITPDREVQTFIRDAANTAMKGIVLEIDHNVDITPLSDLYDHMQEEVAKIVEEKGLDAVQDLLDKVGK